MTQYSQFDSPANQVNKIRSFLASTSSSESDKSLCQWFDTIFHGLSKTCINTVIKNAILHMSGEDFESNVDHFPAVSYDLFIRFIDSNSLNSAFVLFALQFYMHAFPIYKLNHQTVETKNLLYCYINGNRFSTLDRMTFCNNVAKYIFSSGTYNLNKLVKIFGNIDGIVSSTQLADFLYTNENKTYPSLLQRLYLLTDAYCLHDVYYQIVNN